VGNHIQNIAWNHRTANGYDIYFVSNQHLNARTAVLSFRISGKTPELFDPLTGEIRTAPNWKTDHGRTILPLKLEGSGSLFVVFRNAKASAIGKSNWPVVKTAIELKKYWTVKFDKAYGGPDAPLIFEGLQDWSHNLDDHIRYYSGTVAYSQIFKWDGGPSDKTSRIAIDLGTVDNLADVYVNGIFCGTAWTNPYRVDITKALKTGNNELRIEVSNTWANRLIGDQALAEDKRITWTNAPYRLDKKPLLPAGLLGPVKIVLLDY
jgi:hypothetical protein